MVFSPGRLWATPQCTLQGCPKLARSAAAVRRELAEATAELEASTAATRARLAAELSTARSELEHEVTSRRAELENEILLKQVIGAMEPRVREMFALRSAGHSWKEVGRQFGISAHNAEVQFAYGLKKAKAQLGLDEEPPQSRRGTK